MNIEILYEDNHLLVVVKPPHILVQGDISGDTDLLTILKEDIKHRYNKPGNVFLGLVHRLDRPVGGAIVFGKTSKAASRLSEQIRNHEMKKVYLCVVHGLPEPLKGRLVDALLKDRDNNLVRVVNLNTPGSKEAILEYEVLRHDSHTNLSLVKINLITGRSHQIRVQMAHLGTSLLGDNKYGERVKGTDTLTHSLALWSHQIGIIHPTTKEKMLFTSSPPNEFPWIG